MHLYDECIGCTACIVSVIICVVDHQEETIIHRLKPCYCIARRLPRLSYPWANFIAILIQWTRSTLLYDRLIHRYGAHKFTDEILWNQCPKMVCLRYNHLRSAQIQITIPISMFVHQLKPSFSPRFLCCRHIISMYLVLWRDVCLCKQFIPYSVNPVIFNTKLSSRWIHSTQTW